MKTISLIYYKLIINNIKTVVLLNEIGRFL